jgi:hypothetical protein
MWTVSSIKTDRYDSDQYKLVIRTNVHKLICITDIHKRIGKHLLANWIQCTEYLRIVKIYKKNQPNVLWLGCYRNKTLTLLIKLS